MSQRIRIWRSKNDLCNIEVIEGFRDSLAATIDLHGPGRSLVVLTWLGDAAPLAVGYEGDREAVEAAIERVMRKVLPWTFREPVATLASEPQAAAA